MKYSHEIPKEHPSMKHKILENYQNYAMNNEFKDKKLNFIQTNLKKMKDKVSFLVESGKPFFGLQWAQLEKWGISHHATFYT